ncbi:MAG: hypothetical protein GYA33_12750 [Thermogutta sp.]|nr:hypothetical protein [Thermogutta sp.]
MRTKWSVLVVSAIVLGASCWGMNAAWAVIQFRNEFVARYVKKESKEPKDQAFARLVEEAKCNICHVGTDRKQRNVYGQALDRLLDRTKDARNKEKIQAALAEVESEKVDPKDPKSATFGDRIKAGELPVPVPKEEKK